jgi:ubiquinone/menaquinone biosynthesis C-methylase UbiE
MNTQDPDIDAIKAKHKATWEDGNYPGFASYMQDGAIEVLDSWRIPPGKKLLDVACGAGQTAIPAARTGIHVTGVDIAENLVEHARRRAAEEGLTAQFDVGDAEALPYNDGTFDVLVSMFGAMFAPRPERVTSEFARVLAPGGTLYMANWTSASMPAQMFKCVAGVVPPPAGVKPPVLWGDEDTVRERLADDFTDIRLTRRIYPQWHYPFDASGVVELFRTHFGPVKRAFEALDESQQSVLHKDLETIYRNNSEVRDDTLTITGGEFLEVIAARK